MSLAKNGLHVVQEMDEVKSPDFARIGEGLGQPGNRAQGAVRKELRMAEEVADLIGLIKQTEEAKASQTTMLKQQE